MASKAVGINKRVAYSKEVTWGTVANPVGAKQVRRVTADLNLTKETYSSNEIRTDYQTADMRGGVRTVDGSLSGELSPGTYADFLGSVLADDFSTVVGVASADITIAAAGLNFTITRATGDYLVDGIKVGQVVRLSGAGLNAANTANNALVIAVTATVLTVKVLSSTAFVAEGPITGIAITPTGKVSAIPQTGHTDDSYTFEQWYSDIAQSEVFTGVKISSASIKLPATGLVTVDFAMKGKDLELTGTSEYFTTPTAAGNTGIFAAVQGALLVNGSEAGCITDASISIERAMENAQCVGQNVSTAVFTGKINVTGNLSAYFSDATLRDYFDNETEVTVVLALTTSEAKNADAISVVLPRVKFGSASAADTELGITQSLDFTALLNSVTTAGLPNTTIQIQDTTL